MPLNVQRELAKAKKSLANGFTDEAFRIYSNILKVFPENPVAKKALHNLTTQDFESDSASKSIAEHLDSLERMYNNGEHTKLVEAGTALCKQFPAAAKLQFLLGSSNQILGNDLAAVAHFQSALQIEPTNAMARASLANVFLEQGRIDEAIQGYFDAIALGSNEISVFNNLGNAFLRSGNPKNACTYYEKALEIDSACASAYQNLAVTQTTLGNYAEAIRNYREAIRLDSNLLLSKYNLALLLASNIPQHKNYSDSWAATYLELLRTPGIINPNALSAQILHMLRQHPLVQAALSQLDNNPDASRHALSLNAINDLPLLLQLISTSSVTDLQFEKLLVTLRKEMLIQSMQNASLQEATPLQIALAIHYFINEFVVKESPAEQALLTELESELEQGFRNDIAIPPMKIAMLACFRPLHACPWKDQLATIESIEAIVRVHITEVIIEEKLKETLPQLSEPEDIVSVQVRKQYEENPYPRWVTTRLDRYSRTILDVMQSAGIRVNQNSLTLAEAPQVLIAGCGTGQHALLTASRFRNSKVLAIDLSLRSLAYAKRKSQEYGLQNIEFMHADILELAKLERQFDIIESVGVLHHMSDPRAGWRILSDCLKTGSLMKIGLYSEIARKAISETRARISALGIGDTNEDIRQFRATLINSSTADQSLLGYLARWPDFYCTSEFRDLIFHKHEHRFDLLEIDSILKQLSLNFAGFEFPDNRKKELFIAENPNPDDLYDVRHWHKHELNHPDTFSGMYQFWLQKN